MPSVSNGVFLPLLPPAPLPAAGWTVKVIDRTDLLAYAQRKPVTPIAQIYRVLNLSCSPELSGECAGSVTLSATDPIWSYPLADGRSPEVLWTTSNLWVLYQNGQWRGEFFNEKVEYPVMSTDGLAAKTLTISGPGTAHALQWASVLSPYYPKPAPTNTIAVYQYKNLPIMSSWLQLLAAAQKRGTIAYIRPTFTATKDSAGVKWADTPPPKSTKTVSTTLGSVMFTDDSSALTVAGQAAVKTLAAQIAKLVDPVVTVTGHTDSNGSEAYNYQQGLDRANTVSNALQAITPMTVNAVSKGETQPVASNKTAAGRAKNRRAVVSWVPQDTSLDTLYTPQIGTKLLDLLQGMTSGTTTAENRGPIHCEWLMGARFALDVRQQPIGVDRSKTVIFHEGSTYVTAEADTYDRSDVANSIAVMDTYYSWKTALVGASVRRWGQREMYTALQDAFAADIWAKIVSAQAQAYSDEQISITVQILPGPYRTPWVDFGIGDWIAISRSQGFANNQVDRLRVTAITVTVDTDGKETYELTLQTTRQARITWLQTQIDALMLQHKGVQVYQQNVMPGGGAPGDFWTTITDSAAASS